jgi:signal transduction histidine kinase
MLNSKAKEILISATLSVVVTISASVIFEAIIRIPENLQEKLSTNFSRLIWWEVLLILLLASFIGILTEKVGTRKMLPFISFCIGMWLAISLIGKTLYSIDFRFTQVAFSFIFPVVTIHLKKLWKIDIELTEKLVSLSSFSYLFDAKTAEQRIESALKLMQTILPISESIIFYLADGELKPIGRTKGSMKDFGVSSTARQAAWREKIIFCEEALVLRKTKVLKSEDNTGYAQVAVPLISEDEEVGVLYVEINSDFENEDKNLLEAISEQLARNFQRRELRKKSLPNKFFWSMLSAESAKNRVELLKLVRSNIKEQSFSVLATSYFKEAFAVAYLDGTLAYMNPQMRTLAGLKNKSLAEIDLFRLLECFKTEVFNEPSLALRKILQTGESYENELFFQNTGKTLKIQISLVKISYDRDLNDSKESTRDNESTGSHKTSNNKTLDVLEILKPACFLVVIDDITVVKENERLRSDMVNLMSHEIRTPITSIQGFAELLLADESVSPENKEFLEIIVKESQRLSRMLTTFLSLAKLEQSDKKEFHKIPVKLDSIVSEVVKDMQEKAKRKRIRLVEKADPHLPPIAADKGLITRAITHLVDNAIKYSPERTSVTISTSLETDYLRVTVEDRGYGIPKDEQEKIWQKFYRIAREGQDKEEESTGLGLALVKEIVERHGGQVEVESEVGFGSKFTIRLPRL